MSDSLVRKALEMRGVGDVDHDNPIHVIAGLHPNHNIRVAAAKLSACLDLKITEVCNFKCGYCYQRSRDDDWHSVAEASEAH